MTASVRFPGHLDGDFLDKAGKQSLAVAVGGLRCVPNPLQRGSEVREERRRRGLGLLFPGRCDQAVVGVNLPMAPFRKAGLVATVLNLQLLIPQRRFRPLRDRLRSGPRRLQPRGRHQFQEPAGNDPVDFDATNREAASHLSGICRALVAGVVSPLVLADEKRLGSI